MSAVPAAGLVSMLLASGPSEMSLCPLWTMGRIDVGVLEPAMIASACGSEVTATRPREPSSSTHWGETTSSRSLWRFSETRDSSSQLT